MRGALWLCSTKAPPPPHTRVHPPQSPKHSLCPSTKGGTLGCHMTHFAFSVHFLFLRKYRGGCLGSSHVAKGVFAQWAVLALALVVAPPPFYSRGRFGCGCGRFPNSSGLPPPLELFSPENEGRGRKGGPGHPPPPLRAKGPPLPLPSLTCLPPSHKHHSPLSHTSSHTGSKDQCAGGGTHHDMKVSVFETTIRFLGGLARGLASGRRHPSPFHPHLLHWVSGKGTAKSLRRKATPLWGRVKFRLALKVVPPPVSFRFGRRRERFRKCLGTFFGPIFGCLRAHTTPPPGGRVCATSPLGGYRPPPGSMKRSLVSFARLVLNLSVRRLFPLGR